MQDTGAEESVSNGKKSRVDKVNVNGDWVSVGTRNANANSRDPMTCLATQEQYHHLIKIGPIEFEIRDQGPDRCIKYMQYVLFYFQTSPVLIVWDHAKRTRSASHMPYTKVKRRTYYLGNTTLRIG